MNYARLLLISIIIFVFLSGTTVVILSQTGSTRQVGVATCELYTEGSGVREIVSNVVEMIS